MSYNANKGGRAIKELVVANCWQYIFENFHKFSQVNKIKIALELCKKDIPTEIIGEVKFTQMPAARLGNRIGELLPLEFDIGEPSLGAAGDIVSAGEAPANPN